MTPQNQSDFRFFFAGCAVSQCGSLNGGVFRSCGQLREADKTSV
jgi:hypothetical protein